jgi:hypothetical protein
MAQGFGFVVPARKRRNTHRISSFRASASEPKHKPAANRVLCVEVPGPMLVSRAGWALGGMCAP